MLIREGSIRFDKKSVDSERRLFEITEVIKLNTALVISDRWRMGSNLGILGIP